MRRGLAILAALVVSLIMVVGPALPAHAHGEGTQQSWVRTLTATFFDVRFVVDGNEVRPGEDAIVPVGEHLTIRGKVALSDRFPWVLGRDFGLGYLGVNMPGPVLAVRERRINGAFVPGSTEMNPGDSFDFEIDLVGRQPGRWHIHPRLDLKTKGGVMGPGQWIQVREGEPYRRQVTLLSGDRVDLESYGLGTVLGWHAVWIVLGGAFSCYWLRKGLIARFHAVQDPVPDRDLVGVVDRRRTVAFGGLALVVLVGGALYAGGSTDTIPLQVRREVPAPGDDPPMLAEPTVDEVRLDEGRRELRMVVDLHRPQFTPLTVERLVVGPLSFVTAPYADSERGEPRLTVTVAEGAGDPVGTRLLLRMDSEVLDDNGLVYTNSAVAQFGGLLVLRGPDGQRGWTFVAGDLIKHRS